MAYLLYLPFCSVFVSNDRLHRLCAPLFLRPNQSFFWGKQLKADLAGINAYYSTFPDEVKKQGIFKFAKGLPDESQGIIREIYQKHTPRLLEPPLEDKLDADTHKKIMDSIDGWEAATEPPPGSVSQETEYTSLIIKRLVNPKKGSWVQVATETQEKKPD